MTGEIRGGQEWQRDGRLKGMAGGEDRIRWRNIPREILTTAITTIVNLGKKKKICGALNEVEIQKIKMITKFWNFRAKTKNITQNSSEKVTQIL